MDHGSLDTRLSLHIEELVLDGFTGADGGDIRLAMQHELTRLFADHGAPSALARGGEVASLNGGAFHVAPGSDARRIGSQIARAVYGGLGRGKEV